MRNLFFNYSSSEAERIEVELLYVALAALDY